jgi:hypothetical protein
MMIGSAGATARHDAAMRVEGPDGARLRNPDMIAHACVPFSDVDGNHVGWTDRPEFGYSHGAGTRLACDDTVIAPWLDALGHTGYIGSLGV